jgi:hypothetical protein
MHTSDEASVFSCLSNWGQEEMKRRQENVNMINRRISHSAENLGDRSGHEVLCSHCTLPKPASFCAIEKVFGIAGVMPIVPAALLTYLSIRKQPAPV